MSWWPQVRATLPRPLERGERYQSPGGYPGAAGELRGKMKRATTSLPTSGFEAGGGAEIPDAPLLSHGSRPLILRNAAGVRLGKPVGEALRFFGL
jgi:hypothetical protein